MDVTQLLRDGGTVSGQRNFALGYVSTSKPAPSSFDAQLWVVLPDFSPDHSLPVTWSALHGQTLPAQGAQVLVVFDDRGAGYAMWWAGTLTQFGPWTAITYDASGTWADAGGAAPLQYRTSGDGTVAQMRGKPAVQAAHTATVSSSTIATLPSGSPPRPAYAQTFAARFVDQGGIGATVVGLNVSTGGVISLIGDLTGRAPVGAAGSVLNIPLVQWTTLP